MAALFHGTSWTVGLMDATHSGRFGQRQSLVALCSSAESVHHVR